MPQKEAVILEEFSRVIKNMGDGNWTLCQTKLQDLLDRTQAVVNEKASEPEHDLRVALLDTIQITYNICSRKVKEEKSHL